MNWLHRVLRRLRDWSLPADAVPIKPPVVRFGKADPGVRERTLKRRAIADDARQRAAAIESGESVQRLLRSVK